MIKGGTGGGNTLTGLNFEKTRNILKLFESMKDYSIAQDKIGWKILYKKKYVAHSYKKYDLYKYLETRNVDWKKLLSKRLLPDDALYVILNNVLYIIEIKFQQVGGSVDEKLQTCDFKKKQYKKLMSQLNIDVEYIYIFNDWFKASGYKDSLDYIISVGCHYYFDYLPLAKIGLPVPE